MVSDITRYQDHIEILDMRILSRNNKIKELRRQLTLEQLQHMLGGSDKSMQDMHEKIMEKYQVDEDKITLLNERVEEIEALLTAKEKEISLLNKSLQMEVSKSAKSVQSYNKDLFDSQEKIKILSNEAKQRHILLITREAMIQSSTLRIGELEDCKRDLEDEVQELEKNLAKANETVKSLENEADAVSLETSKLRHELQKLQESSTLHMYEKDIAEKSAYSWRENFLALQTK